MHFKKMFNLLLILPVLFLGIACSDDNSTEPEEQINEAEVLVKYLEVNGDFINSSAPAMIQADTVEANRLAPDFDQYIIDIRTAEDYGNGHIPGAVNVIFSDLLNHYTSNSLQDKDQVVIACYSGQTGAYGTSILRMMGFDNVKDLMWGMSSWHKDFAENVWQERIGNNFTSFVTDVTAKGTAGELPVLETGKTDPAEILEERANALLTAGFASSKVSYSAVTGNPADYYIVNYWNNTDYALGHIPGAIQYLPKADLKSDTFLNTLPTDKPVVVYCYTGQTSAHIVAYLNLLGYEGKSLVYGVNTMNYDWMVSHEMTHFDDHYIMNFDYETEN